MSTQDTPKEANTWILCVVVLEQKKPRKYKNFFLAISGTEQEATLMQRQVAKKGFKAEGRRFFPDEIETLNLKEGEEENE